MKIITFNINGISSKLEWISKFLQKENPDIISFNEIKASADRVKMMIKSGVFLEEGYTSIWNPAKKSSFHGTLVLIKNTVIYDENSIITELPTSSTDPDVIQAHQHEGRIISLTILHPLKFQYIAVYVPNSGVNWKDPLRRLSYRINHWDPDLFRHVHKMHVDVGAVVLAGDLNVARNKLDIYNPKMTNVAGFTPQERSSFENFLHGGDYIDIWRELHQNARGVTYRKSNNDAKGWRLDYFIISKLILSYVDSCEIMPTGDISDHYALMLELNV